MHSILQMFNASFFKFAMQVFQIAMHNFRCTIPGGLVALLDQGVECGQGIPVREHYQGGSTGDVEDGI
jgi:hypothetical protein